MCVSVMTAVFERVQVWYVPPLVLSLLKESSSSLCASTTISPVPLSHSLSGEDSGARLIFLSQRIGTAYRGSIAAGAHWTATRRLIRVAPMGTGWGGAKRMRKESG